MVSSKNNNKYYEMTEKDGEIHIVYGRVGATGIAIKASLSEWDSLVRSKMKKGYVDMTNLGSDMTNAGDDIYLENSSPDVKSLISELNNFSNISIVSNYNVGVGSVTKEQLDSAQSILDELYKVNENFKNDEDFLNSFNEKLLKLYAVIPRKMKKVQDYLINDKSNKDSAASLLDDQQEILDVMATQVKITKHDQSDQPDFLKKNGLVVEDASQDEIKLLKKMMCSDSHLFYRAFRVTNNQTQTLFDNFVQKKRNQKRELFWHGSKNANFLSIMINGLQLRPAANGRMFGHGNYFGKFLFHYWPISITKKADKFKKSLGYTSFTGSYWAGGSSDKAYLAVFDVHVGKQLEVTNWDHTLSDFTEESLTNYNGQDYDSLFAKAKNGFLLNNEFIVYNSAQCTIKFMVEIKQ